MLIGFYLPISRLGYSNAYRTLETYDDVWCMMVLSFDSRTETTELGIWEIKKNKIAKVTSNKFKQYVIYDDICIHV